MKSVKLFFIILSAFSLTIFFNFFNTDNKGDSLSSIDKGRDPKANGIVAIDKQQDPKANGIVA